MHKLTKVPIFFTSNSLYDLWKKEGYLSYLSDTPLLWIPVRQFYRASWFGSRPCPCGQTCTVPQTDTLLSSQLRLARKDFPWICVSAFLYVFPENQRFPEWQHKCDLPIYLISNRYLPTYLYLFILARYLYIFFCKI